MRFKLIAIVSVVLLLFGCQNQNDSMDQALALRNKIAVSNGCGFQCEVIADYGEDVYTFEMECEFDKNGDMTFCVTQPNVIHGIRGVISQNTGKLTFDDQVIAFQTMADGQLTPIIAPWLFMKTLKSGYIDGCTNENGGYYISADDSYEEDALHLNVWTDGELFPKEAEIYWQGRRLITITVENFTYL